MTTITLIWLNIHYDFVGGTQTGSASKSGASATSPKTTAANLASAIKTVFASFGKAKSEEK